MRLSTLTLSILFLFWSCVAPPSSTSAPSSSEGSGPTADKSSDEKDEGAKGDESAAKDDPVAKAKEKEEKEKKEKEEKIKKFEEATEKLTSSTGFFPVWHDENRLFLQLDKDSFGREFLYQAALGSGAGNGSLYRGAMLSDNEFVLRFERRGKDKIVLLAENSRYLDGGDSFDQRRRDESVSDSIIQSFDLVAENPDTGVVYINLGDWFFSDNLQLSHGAPGKYGISRDLSLYKNVRNFPRNLDVEQELVLTGERTGGNLTMADGRGLSLTVVHSLCAMPEAGFKPRAFDQRVGYFTVDRKDLLDVESKDPVKRFIARWRLQKKDPTAEVSDPVTPITYWIENTTPKKWRDAVRKGIEAWEPAFRKAGFSNGIVAKQMPEDADWDPADVRYATVRWSSDENVSFAIGPSRTDPRTGEIFDADITMQESFLIAYGRRFDNYVADLAGMTKDEIRQQVAAELRGGVPEGFEPSNTCEMAGLERAFQVERATVLASMLDPALDKDAFLAAMLTEVVAHEVGHTLGLRHNFKASCWRSMTEVADASATAQSGLVGSVMDYNAINIAAPGSKQGEYFPSVAGPYDIWAIEYGYSEFGGNEALGLKALAARSHEPGLDYGTDEDSFMGDAYATTWDLSADPVAFARDQIALAEEGFRRLADKGADKGEGYAEYRRFYSMFASMYARSHRGLERFIGGFTMNRDVVGQESGRAPLVAIDTAKQRAALDLVLNKGLKWTGGIPDEQRLLLVNQKYGSWGTWFDEWSFDAIPRIVNATRYASLSALMDPWVYEQLGSQARLGLADAVGPHELADSVYAAVWPESPDEHDRWTQSDYVGSLITNLEMDTTPDITALFDTLLTRAEKSCKTYASSGARELAAHGEWLGGRIQRWRERQKVELF